MKSTIGLSMLLVGVQISGFFAGQAFPNLHIPFHNLLPALAIALVVFGSVMSRWDS